MRCEDWFRLFIVSWVHFTYCKRTQGILSSRKDFVYLDRFCFQSDTGTLEYSFKYPYFYPRQLLLLYYDTEDQWPRAYKQLTTCEDRIHLLSNHSENNQIIRLNPYANDIIGGGRCKVHKNDLNEDWIICMGTRIFRSARSRWWFLAIANCDPDEDDEKRMYENETIGVYAEFSLQMTNGLPSEILKYQFSIDEWLILPSDSVFLFLQSILIIIVYIMGVSLSSRRLYHNTYRMCSQSIVLNSIGLSFLVANYAIYAIDGVGLPIIKTTGQFIRALADMLYVYMCLVLARGLNVTKMRLSLIDKLFLSVMIMVFLFSYLLMQFWEMKYFDPAMVFAQSESVPGYLLALWRLIAYAFFLGAALLTRNESQLKKSFFNYFIVLMTPWFWAPPIFTLIANFALNNWVRAEVVNIVENVVTFYGYCIFLWLSRPTNGNVNFPFHIRTTQVDIDVGFDPHTAYGATTNELDLHDGLHGIQPIELSDTSHVEVHQRNQENKNDLGIVQRPQFS